MINQLNLVQAHPQPEFRQQIPLPKEIQGLCQSLTMSSQEINDCKPVDAKFHQFSRLPLELRETIWWLALPAPRPFEIIIRTNDQRKDSCVWAVGPFAMLKVCQQSRRIALSVYEPRLELYTSRENPGRVLYARPNTILRPEGHVFIYMRKGHPLVDIEPDSEVHSVIAWEDILLGFMIMQVASSEFVNIKCFQNWPPEEDEEVKVVLFRKNHYEWPKNRSLPLRLQNLSLLSYIHGMLRRH